MKLNGYEVVDVNESLNVVVTKADIVAGAKKNAKSCAVAQAICRQYGADEAIVQTTRAYMRKGKKWKRFAVATNLRTEIVAFDRGGHMAEGNYTLHPVQPSVRLDAQPVRRARGWKGGNAYKSSRNGKAARAYNKTKGIRESLQGKCDWE